MSIYYHYIYQITNKTNGHIYVGVRQSKVVPELDIKYMGSGKLVISAIKKHGKHQFEKKIISIHKNRETAMAAEAFIVNEDFVMREDTYNISLGGQGGVIKGTCSEETRRKLSKALKGKTAHNKGKSPSEETRDKMSISQKIRTKNGQPESQRLAAKEVMIKVNKIIKVCEKCGKTNTPANHKRWHSDNCGIKIVHSEETKKKIGESLKGRIMSERCKLSLLESNKKRKGKKYPNGYKTKDKILDSF